MGYDTGLPRRSLRHGRAHAAGLLDAPASGRMAVGEALTNLAAADIGDISATSSSRPTGWRRRPRRARMPPVRHRQGRFRLLPAIGVSIPVGKDSLSMRTAWEDARRARSRWFRRCRSIITAFAAVDDVRKTLTPQLAVDARAKPNCCCSTSAKNRLGGSALAQVYNATGSDAPDADDPAQLKGLFDAVQRR
jgi:phosphoribosylformylglycinamidine synthase